MAKGGAWGCLDRRDLLNEPSASPQKLLKAANDHLEADLMYDAIDFLARAGAGDRIVELAEAAAGEGDLFLYLHALKAAQKEPEAQTLKNLADEARRKGWQLFADKAAALAGRAEADG